ncbi:MAG: TetR family transcriptional regulator, partial [Rhodobacterales bacterium]
MCSDKLSVEFQMVKPIADIRRPAIVQAAIRTIGKHGLPTPSYDLIAQEAEMSRQLVRHYFPNPEELMVSVCDGLAAAYEEALAEGILNADKSG